MLMSSFAGSIAGLFVCGMVGGYAGLVLLAPTPEGQTAVARVADPPAVPCSMQAWPNADRKCLDWTAPRTGDAKTAAAPADKRTNAQPTTVGLSLDPTLHRHEIAQDPQSDTDVAAAPATPDPAPVATPPAAKARTATRTKTRPLAAVPSNAYAYDGSARRYRQSQGSFFGFGGGGFFR
jgi:hypothetical protein